VDEAEGDGWLDAVHPDDRAEVAALWADALARAAPYKVRYRLRGRDGDYRYFLVRVVPVKEPDGRVREWVGTFTDVDDRARLEQERQRLLEVAESARARAEEASWAKDEFLAMVSHELRTPLNAMVGWIRLLRSDKLDEATFRRGMDTIERNAKAQAQLIEDLLDVSRIVTGKLRLDVRPVELGPVVEAALDSVRPAAEAKGIHLVASVTGASGLVSGDPERLQQVVWNLLTNAIKFTPDGGEVRLSLRRSGGQVEVTVTDTGKGIAPEFLPYVFERFRQGDAAAARTRGGLGLGLAIVRHIVEMHGGTVSAESAGLGQGATFQVTLPAVAAHMAAGTDRAGSGGAAMFASPQSLAGLRVLVVEDEEDSREMLLLVLGECGAEVRGAESSEEALRALEEWQPDVLVSDIGMPGDDGYELIRRVRALGPDRGGAVPAIALTAYARVEDRMRALEAGFHMHVGKPVEPAELVLVIDSLLKMVRRAPPAQSTAAES
jgi:signal transduction histidine kinase/ActR/RegA family two-component response regulator